MATSRKSSPSANAPAAGSGHVSVPSTEGLPRGVELRGPLDERQREIVSNGALELVADLTRRFGWRVDELLARRRERQARLDHGEKLDFLPETAEIRSSAWTVAPLPKDLLDRRVEITGPVDRKMIINALNSGANVFMADFEDSNSPTWANGVQGQVNLYDAVRRTITFSAPETGKSYQLSDKVAVLFVRPRGWHLVERHVLVDGRPVPGGLFDFGVYFFHNAKELLARGSGPYFYLPKMESHLEARLWNDVFVRAAGGAGRAEGQREGHLPHRDAARRVRDGRDPLRAARALGGAQLRALGLHLQLHQEAARRPARGAARPRPGDDGPRVPGGLRAAPHPDLPPARRARHGRHGGADPDQGRPGRQRGGARQGAGRQAARGEGGPRRHLGGAPRPGGPRQGHLRRAHEGAEPARREARGREDRRRPSSSPCRRGSAPRPGCATRSACRSSTSRRGCAAPAACRSTT